MFGRNWKKVESYIGTRTGTQIRSHAQKYFNRRMKEGKIRSGLHSSGDAHMDSKMEGDDECKFLE